MHRIVLDPNAVRPQLPPYAEISHSAIRDAAAGWNAAKADLNLRKRDVIELEQTREAAEWRDAEAAEAAPAAGKAEPKRSHVQAHDRQLDAARHEHKVATLVEGRASERLQAALDEHQGDWLSNATLEIEALSEAWNAAVATLADLHGKLGRAHRARGFASNGDAENDGPGVLTSAIRVSPRDVQGLDFAPLPAGSHPTPGSLARAPKGTVDIGHVLAELAQMGRLPAPEPAPEPRELQTVNVLGQARTIAKPLTDEQRAERIARADQRRAARERERDEINALIYGGAA